jgi:hypothetical protein
MSTTSINVIKASKISGIDVSLIEIGDKHDKKAKISIKKQPIVIQTPYLEIYMIRSQPNGIYEVFTLCRGDAKKRIERWIKFVGDYESHIFNKIRANPQVWFTDNEVNYKELISEDENGALIKWIINSNITSCYNQSQLEIPIDNLRPQDKIQFIVEISYLWFKDNQFGTAHTVQKMRVKEYIEPIFSEYVFDDSKSDSEEEEEEAEHEMISLMATEQRKKPTKKLELQLGSSNKPAKPNPKALEKPNPKAVERSNPKAPEKPKPKKRNMSVLDPSSNVDRLTDAFDQLSDEFDIVNERAPQIMEEDLFGDM